MPRLLLSSSGCTSPLLTRYHNRCKEHGETPRPLFNGFGGSCRGNLTGAGCVARLKALLLPFRDLF